MRTEPRHRAVRLARPRSRLAPRALAPVALAALLALGVRASEAHHNATHDQNPEPPAALGPVEKLQFEAGSLIIPMDGCYQRPNFMSNSDVDKVIAPQNRNQLQCDGNNDKDGGLIPAYTLAFRLVQAGIPVHWAILEGKTSWHQTDFIIVRAGGAPVRRFNPGSAGTTNPYSGITTVRYRGAPFVIAAADAAAARQVMDSVASTCNQGTCYSDVNVHVSQVAFDAPIYRTVESLPKMAVIDASDPLTNLVQEKTNFLKNSIAEALMDDLEGTLFDWVTIPQVLGDHLTTAGYDLVWVPPFDLPTSPTARQQDFIGKLAAFVDGGGSALFQDGSIAAIEGYGTVSGSTYTATQAPVQSFHSDGGLQANGVSSTWDNGSNSELTYGQDYSDPASQWGGIVWTGIGGSKYNWRPRQDRAYLPGVRRMVYSYHATDLAKRNWEFASWRRKDNDADKGIIYYLGGFHWRRNTSSGFRVLMNTILTTITTEPDETIEIARSSPIVAFVDGVEAQYQGTFETSFPPEPAASYSGLADADTFQYPHWVGHLRALDVGQLADGQNEFSQVSDAILFDAADHLPPVSYTGDGGGTFEDAPANGLCRRIFTDTGAASNPAETMVVQANVATLKMMLGFADDDAANLLIARIHAGRRTGSGWVPALGGVDRSTMAVIEPSPLIPNGRPTMIYVGGLDGMLHAICAEAGPGCPAAGVELWAFLPSTELSKVATNTTRIDGSPKVADVFGEFSSGKGMRTVLTFQTGNRLPSATYALDVTDPTRPDVLWRVDTPGPGVGAAMGWVRDGAMIRSVTFVQSAAEPGAASGYEVRAIDTASGEVLWNHPHTYPDPVRNDLNPEVPGTSMPGGVTLVPGITGTRIDYLLVPTLFGQVYKLDAKTGDSVYGDDPLFDFDEDFHPIGASVALYRGGEDGLLRALVVSGGFADPFAPSGIAWAPDDVHQYAVGFPVGVGDLDNVPIKRAQVAQDESLGIHIDFGAGQRAFSPAVIAGGEVFITTDERNVNAADYGSVSDTGRLWRANLGQSGQNATYVVIPSGAASVDFASTTGSVVGGGASGVFRHTPTGFDSVGASAEVRPEMASGRRLWLRLR